MPTQGYLTAVTVRYDSTWFTQH